MARRASLGNQPTQERWVCPNDRHLALRAKLKMGWSTSQPAPVTRQDSLSEAETKIILEVIKRAEELEMNEQLRIGRLVERVETMKGRVQGNGNSNCILCGESLPVLRTSSHACADCNKRVCSKCGVDTVSPTGEKMWLCKICGETREVWKRSGAWFFRGLPKYVLPTTSHSAPGSTTTSKRRAPPRRAHTLGVKGGGGSEGDDHHPHHPHQDEENQRRLRKMASECVGGGGELDTPPPHSAHPPLSPHPRSRSVSPSPFRFDSQESAGGRDSSDDHASDKSPVSPAKEAARGKKTESSTKVPAIRRLDGKTSTTADGKSAPNQPASRCPDEKTATKQSDKKTAPKQVTIHCPDEKTEKKEPVIRCPDEKTEKKEPVIRCPDEKTATKQSDEKTATKQSDEKTAEKEPATRCPDERQTSEGPEEGSISEGEACLDSARGGVQVAGRRTFRRKNAMRLPAKRAKKEDAG